MHANARRKLRRLREGGAQQHGRNANVIFDEEFDEDVELNDDEQHVEEQFEGAQSEQKEKQKEREEEEDEDDDEEDDSVGEVFHVRGQSARGAGAAARVVTSVTRGENNAKNRKRNARRKRARKRANTNGNGDHNDERNDDAGAPSHKYYLQRYSLFSRFDLGVLLDEEAWYSVTPERLAQHHAQRLIDSGCSGVVDACCGVGGNAIQFALALEKSHRRRSAAASFQSAQFNVNESGEVQNVLCGKDLLAYLTSAVRVVAVDVNEDRLRMARTNAEVYDVSDDSVLWWKRNFLSLSDDETSQLQRVADAVFVSPPWGGPSYARKKNFFLSDMPIDGAEFWKAARRVSPNVAMFLPRNIDVACLQQLAPNESFELEVNYLNDRCKAVTAYWGSG